MLILVIFDFQIIINKSVVCIISPLEITSMIRSYTFFSLSTCYSCVYLKGEKYFLRVPFFVCAIYLLCTVHFMADGSAASRISRKKKQFVIVIVAAIANQERLLSRRKSCYTHITHLFFSTVSLYISSSTHIIIIIVSRCCCCC